MDQVRERLLASDDRQAPGALSMAGFLSLGLALLIILSPILFFPLGPDQGMFFVSGEKILQGGIHYRDIVDIKPPLIYYLYAGSIALFGHGDIAIRLLDLLLQMACCGIMFLTVRRATGSNVTAVLAVVIYSVLYVSMGFHNTAQSESYAGLLGMGMIYLLLFRRTSRGFLLAGMLAGLAFLLKFTLGSLLLAALVSEYLVFESRGRELIGAVQLLTAGFGLMAGLLALYLASNDAIGDFLLVSRFTRGYIGIVWISVSHWFAEAVKIVPAHLSTEYSLLLVLASAAGVYRSTRYLPEMPAMDRERSGAMMSRICTIAFIMLLATAVIEGKYFTYQFSRIYPFGAVLAGYGALVVVRWLSDMRRGGYERLLAGLGIMAMLIFSPLPRYFVQAAPMYLEIAGRHDAAQAQYDRVAEFYPRAELQRIGAYIQQVRRPGERIFVSSSIGALCYHFCRYVPEFKIYHSAFIAAPFAPREWKASTGRFLFDERPRYIILQVTDSNPTLTGTNLSSAAALRQLPGVDSLIATNYSRVLYTGSFEILQRRP
jgi:hypothetical protein